MCALRTFVLNSPLWALWSPPRGPARCFCCGARLARVVRLQKKGGGLRPLEPPLSRAKPAAAAIHRERYRQFYAIKSFHQGCGRSDPAVYFAATGRTRGTCLLCAGVVPSILLRNVPGTPWKLHQSPTFFSRNSAA